MDKQCTRRYLDISTCVDIYSHARCRRIRCVCAQCAAVCRDAWGRRLPHIKSYEASGVGGTVVLVQAQRIEEARSCCNLAKRLRSGRGGRRGLAVLDWTRIWGAMERAYEEREKQELMSSLFCIELTVL